MRRLWMLLMVVGMASCSPNPAIVIPSTTPLPLITVVLTPYNFSIQSPAVTPTSSFTATLLPLPTLTPRTHSVRKGESLLSIAIYYGISLDALKAANPGVDPYLLKIGQTLIIPGGAPVPTPAAPTPLPAVGLTLGVANCVRGQDGGAWCFVPVKNYESTAQESVSALLMMVNEKGEQVAQVSALPPLDIIEGKTVTGLSGYFPPQIPENFQVHASLVSALPVATDSGRYLKVIAQSVQQSILPGGLTIEIEGLLTLDKGQPAARLVWVGAVAYDGTGTIVGIRRWESPAGLGPDENLPFSLRVYSTGNPIARVDLFYEARP